MGGPENFSIERPLLEFYSYIMKQNAIFFNSFCMNQAVPEVLPTGKAFLTGAAFRIGAELFSHFTAGKGLSVVRCKKQELPEPGLDPFLNGNRFIGTGTEQGTGLGKDERVP
jgi:hypothetical protein